MHATKTSAEREREENQHSNAIEILCDQSLRLLYFWIILQHVRYWCKMEYYYVIDWLFVFFIWSLCDLPLWSCHFCQQRVRLTHRWSQCFHVNFDQTAAHTFRLIHLLRRMHTGKLENMKINMSAECGVCVWLWLWSVHKYGGLHWLVRSLDWQKARHNHQIHVCRWKRNSTTKNKSKAD